MLTVGNIVGDTDTGRCVGLFSGWKEWNNVRTNNLRHMIIKLGLIASTNQTNSLTVGFGTGDEVTGEEVTGLLEGDVVGAEVTGESECLLLGDTVAARVGASDSMPPPEVEA
jgi:hypothetical protein